MKILIRETGKIAGNQTILFDEKTNQHFKVNSVSFPDVDKTFVLKCDADGEVDDYNEVFTVIPAKHDFIVDALETEMITTANFNFVHTK